MCFVDFRKAFDFISNDKLWVTMMDMGYPVHLIDLLAKLYRKQLSKVKVAGTHQNSFMLRKESDKVLLSPNLFILLVETVMRDPRWISR